MTLPRFLLPAVVGALLSVAAPADASASIVRAIFDCNRGLVQRGQAGLEGVDAAYDNLSAMLEARANPFELWSVLNECLDNRRDLGAAVDLTRAEYYAHITALTGVDVAIDDPRERQLYVLLSGLRDNVARCGTLTGAGVYGVILGAAAETTAGLCHNLEGKSYVKLAGGYGLQLGLGVNLAVFADDRIALYPEENGNFGLILRRFAGAVYGSIFGGDADSGLDLFEILDFNVYAILGAGPGFVIPLSEFAEGPDATVELATCLEGFTQATNADGIFDFIFALDELKSCLTLSSGISFGAGLHLVVAFDLPIHVGIPFVRTNGLLRKVVYRGVDEADLRLVKQRGDLFIEFDPTSIPVPTP